MRAPRRGESASSSPAARTYAPPRRSPEVPVARLAQVPEHHCAGRRGARRAAWCSSDVVLTLFR